MLSMGKLGKTSALILALIIALPCLTLLTVDAANAQAIPKPDVPEFSLRYVDRSYDVPPTTTTTTNPYTGENTTKTTKEGYHVTKQTVEFTIVNQPYIKNANTTGYWASGLFYNFRFKGHYENESNWKTEPAPSGHFDIYYQASNGNETIISLTLQDMAANYYLEGFPKIGDQIDFQVQALVGHERQLDTAIAFSGEKSDWSPTQTIKIGETASTSPTPTAPMPTINTGPHMPEIESFLTSVLYVALILLAAVITLVLLFRKHRKTAS